MAELTPMPSASVMIARKVNPGDFRSCLKAKRKSFISFGPQGFDRVYWRRAACRHEARGRGDDRKEPRDGKINERIKRIYLKEDILQSGSGENSEEQRGRARSNNKPDH